MAVPFLVLVLLLAFPFWTVDATADQDQDLAGCKLEALRTYPDGAFAAASKASIGGLVVENSPMFYGHFRRIADLGVQFRLPTIGHTPQFAEDGGLLAYGADSGQSRVDFAAVVDKILKGTKPADVPVWQGTKFDLTINLKTAKALGLTIPQSLLRRATR